MDVRGISDADLTASDQRSAMDELVTATLIAD